MNDKKPEDFQCSVNGEPTDGRGNLADMARSIDNMAILMTQLHETRDMRGAAVSWIGGAGGELRIFVTATNDVDEVKLANTVVAGFKEVLFNVSCIADERRAHAELVEAVRLFKDSGFHGGEGIIAALAKLDIVKKATP